MPDAPAPPAASPEHDRESTQALTRRLLALRQKDWDEDDNPDEVRVYLFRLVWGLREGLGIEDEELDALAELLRRAAEGECDHG